MYEKYTFFDETTEKGQHFSLKRTKYDILVEISKERRGVDGRKRKEQAHSSRNQ